MHPFHMILVLFLVSALIGLGFVFRWERKQFLARGLVDSWLIVRLSTIPTALVAVALVLIPARSTSGMEGLAIFYLLLLTAAPLFWFGTHWAVGRLVRPQLSFGDSARIAGSPLLYAVAVAMVAPMLQSLAWSVLRSLGIY
jgi:hypothetical protein